MRKERALQVSYRKSLEHYYLVISAEPEEAEDYQLQMVLENRIPGLLPMEVKLREGRREFFYDVSSLQPLGRVYERRELKGEEIRKVFLGILDAMSGLRDYMLEESCVVLDPQYIFVEMDTGVVRLLFLPLPAGDAQKEEDPMLQPAEFLMEHADHRDPQAALYAYRIYQTIRKGNYVMADLRRVLEESAEANGGRTERIPQVTEDAGYDLEEPLEVAQSRKPPKGPGERQRIKPREKQEQKREQKSENGSTKSKAPIILAVILVLGGALFCSGNLPGIYPDKAGKLVAVAMMIAGVAVFAVQQIREKNGERSSSDEPVKATEDLDDIFADLEPVKKEVSEERPQECYTGGEEAEEEYGKTIFTGDLDVPAENILMDVTRKKEYRIEHFPFTIGKMKDCVDLALTDRTVSRIHARILQKNGKAYLQDCHSTNGTYINGVQLEAEETVMLEKDDEIEIGKVKFRYV